MVWTLPALNGLMAPSTEEPVLEIHHADKAYRKRSLWLLAGIVLHVRRAALAAASRGCMRLTAQLGSSDPDTVRRWLRLLLAGLGLALAVPAVGLGLTLRQLGWPHASRAASRRAQWKTLRDVRVLRDARRACAGQSAVSKLAGTVALALAGAACWLGRLGLVAVRLKSQADAT